MRVCVALVIGLMILASCASTGKPKPSEATRAEQGLKSGQAKDAGQDFSHSQDYLDERARGRLLNPLM